MLVRRPVAPVDDEVEVMRWGADMQQHTERKDDGRRHQSERHKTET